MTNWWYFSYFSQKTAFDISRILSPMETICMKCQILFSGKNKKNISVCRLLKILPRVDTEHITWHMVPSFLYDRAKSALSGTPLPWNPSWSTVWRFSSASAIVSIKNMQVFTACKCVHSSSEQQSYQSGFLCSSLKSLSTLRGHAVLSPRNKEKWHRRSSTWEERENRGNGGKILILYSI